jgi:hypothetical protein
MPMPPTPGNHQGPLGPGTAPCSPPWPGATVVGGRLSTWQCHWHRPHMLHAQVAPHAALGNHCLMMPGHGRWNRLTRR